MSFLILATVHPASSSLPFGVLVNWNYCSSFLTPDEAQAVSEQGFCSWLTFWRDKICATGPAKAVVHFVGGAFVGAAPQLSYRLLLESLAARGLYVSHLPGHWCRSK